MFIGHYAAAFGAKALAPRAPLWTLVGAAQLLDVAFSGFLIAGLERFRVDPSLPGNQLVLEHMPWSHSLPAAVLWSVLAAALARMIVPWRVAAIIGGVVFSHWILDWITHRPDLGLWFDGPKVGLGFWNLPVAEMAFEMSLLTLAAGAWIARRKEGHQSAWPALLFLTMLCGLAVLYALPAQEPDNAVYAGVMGLVLFGVVTALAWPIDRSWRAPDAH
ncbi:MAG TPA: hypothetical protein VEA15_06135 [Caulobacteraceae bacterium]|nr:hypothetical protein [Caulobacteraceae bacterium]